MVMVKARCGNQRIRAFVNERAFTLRLIAFVDGPGGGTPSDQQARFCYDCDADYFHLFPLVSRFLPEPPTPVSHALSVLPNATLLAQLCLFGIMSESDGTAASAIFSGSGGRVARHQSVQIGRAHV